jgi:hypothetical protein
MKSPTRGGKASNDGHWSVAYSLNESGIQKTLQHGMVLAGAGLENILSGINIYHL